MPHDPRRLADVVEALLHDETCFAHPPQENERADGDETRLLFLGNPQDPCPRLLLLDPRLAPVDIVTWQAIRVHTEPGKAVAFPSYPELMRWVRVSRATIARAVALRRLTRWLLLAAARRDRSGRFAGSVYALADESLPLSEMLRLDDGYIEFAERACDHRSAHVRQVAATVLEEAKQLAEPRHASGPVALGAHLQARFARLREMMAPCESERRSISGDDRVQNLNPVVSGGAGVQNLNSVDRVQNLNAASCSSSGNQYKTTTTTLGGGEYSKQERSNVQFPSELKLTDSQRRVLALRLAHLPPEARQDVLDEAAARILAKRRTADPVRCEFDYVARLCSLALEGEFTLTDAGLGLRDRRRQRAAAERALEGARAATERRRLDELAADRARHADDPRA